MKNKVPTVRCAKKQIISLIQAPPCTICPFHAWGWTPKAQEVDLPTRLPSLTSPSRPFPTLRLGTQRIGTKQRAPMKQDKSSTILPANAKGQFSHTRRHLFNGGAFFGCPFAGRLSQFQASHSGPQLPAYAQCAPLIPSRHQSFSLPEHGVVSLVSHLHGGIDKSDMTTVLDSGCPINFVDNKVPAGSNNCVAASRPFPSLSHLTLHASWLVQASMLPMLLCSFPVSRF